MVALLEMQVVTNRDIAEWRDTNPLREYRRQHGISQSVLAVIHLDVSQVTIRGWEEGSWRPGPENMDRIGKLLDVNDIEERWNRWMAAKPRVSA